MKTSFPPCCHFRQRGGLGRGRDWHGGLEFSKEYTKSTKRDIEEICLDPKENSDADSVGTNTMG